GVDLGGSGRSVPGVSRYGVGVRGFIGARSRGVIAGCARRGVSRLRSDPRLGCLTVSGWRVGVAAPRSSVRGLDALDATDSTEQTAFVYVNGIATPQLGPQGAIATQFELR